MVRTWKIIKDQVEEIHPDNPSSMDVITRQLPEGYYSTFRTYDGCTRVLGLKSHLRRLPDIDASSLRRHLNQLLEPYRPDETRVRVMQTKQGHLYVSIEPMKALPPEVYKQGVCVETTALHRNTPRIKSTTFIARSLGEREHLVQTGIFEALLVKNGKVLEGMTSNFFYVRDGVLYTAQRDVLLGVTRKNVIRVARGSGVEVRYSPLKLNQLSAVNEAFITSSSRGIVPVIQIDDVTVGEGKVGEITKQLSAVYEACVIQKAERI